MSDITITQKEADLILSVLEEQMYYLYIKASNNEVSDQEVDNLIDRLKRTETIDY